METTVRLLFCAGKGVIPALIRGFTGSRWSHVALVYEDGVIEAAWPKVRLARLDETIKACKAHAYAEFQCPFPYDVLRAAMSQVGKPYDWTAIAGFLVRRDWQKNDRWFCSELVAWAFQCAGKPLFRSDAMHRITPHHLWILAPAGESGTDRTGG